MKSKRDLGAAGSVMEWRTNNGVIREEILKTGLHDVIMGNPVVTMAVMRIIEPANPRWSDLDQAIEDRNEAYGDVEWT